ncbi:ExbD/TolR family protein [Pedomonas sp. V897]|uniref:ExbD/TolR family protein n=1 Tax=Pedomonas sp. V897 TaxID=3446482 RepID=UPI003EDFEF10
MAMSVGEGGGDGAPMGDMNTTPLIDVMLVLLIMFIITIPIQTHAVKLDMPQQTNQPPPETNERPVIHRVEVDFLNQIYWDGQPVDLPTIQEYFRQAASKPNQPEIHIRPDAMAQYEVVDQVLAAAQTVGVTKMGFVGNEAYAQ